MNSATPTAFTILRGESPNLRALLFFAALGSLCVFTGEGTAAGLGDANAIPHVSQRARDAYYQEFSRAGKHRAFAIAPGGAWAWTSAQASAQQAGQAALGECRKHTQQKCVLYAIDDGVVFARSEWNTLWRPYKSAREATAASTGTRIGERFPNLAFTAGTGQTQSISGLKGRVVLVHFWGSWCAPCLREFPSLDLLRQLLRDQLSDDVSFLLLQAREPIEVSRAWAKKHGFDALPLADSGSSTAEDEFFTTAAGERIPDRDVARLFPSSYVLDRNGIVVFSHAGPIDDWSEYLPFLQDLAAHAAN